MVAFLPSGGIAETTSPDDSKKWEEGGPFTPPPGPPYDPLPVVNPTYPGPCPIGIPFTATDGIEYTVYLKDPGIRSGSLCRGACGEQCPDWRCPVKYAQIEVEVPGGTCVYSQVIECASHQGCIDHDCCFDWCVELYNEVSATFPCHTLCTNRAVVQWDYNKAGFDANTTRWAGQFGKGGWYGDDTYPPVFGNPLLFTDPPVFIEKEETDQPVVVPTPEYTMSPDVLAAWRLYCSECSQGLHKDPREPTGNDYNCQWCDTVPQPWG